MATIEHSYEAHGAAADLFECIAPEVLLEGPAGTGKTRAIGEWINMLAEEYAGCRILICRATRVSMTESVLVTWEEKVLWLGHPAITGNASRANRHSYDYPNGSTVVVGGLDNPDRLFSTEWDVIYVAEATEVTEDAWEKFARAMRNKRIPKGARTGGPKQPDEEQAMEADPFTGEPKPAYWTQRIADCNPAAPSHWLNQRPKKGVMVRLRSRHEDNPSIDAGFLQGLKNLTGHRRVRLYEGRWKAAEGTVYPEFDEDRHCIPPFRIPESWPWVVWWDPGYHHPTAIIWMAVAPNGRKYIADEIVRAGKGVDFHCGTVNERTPGRNVRRFYGDPHHAFSSTAQSPTTIAQQAQKYGVNMIPGPSCCNTREIEAQVDVVRAALTTNLPDGRPELVVFNNCSCTINGFLTWSYKKTAAGEVPAGDDKFEDINDDEMDGVRGLIATRPTFAQQRIQIVGQERRGE